MDSFESQLRFGITLSNLNHNENDTTLNGNRFLKNLIDRAQIETKKKSTTNRTNNLPINGKLFTFTSIVVLRTLNHLRFVGIVLSIECFCKEQIALILFFCLLR
jgi:hypothetical protein